jgi:hypothetical protein
VWLLILTLIIVAGLFGCGAMFRVIGWLITLLILLPLGIIGIAIILTAAANP